MSSSFNSNFTAYGAKRDFSFGGNSYERNIGERNFKFPEYVTLETDIAYGNYIEEIEPLWDNLFTDDSINYGYCIEPIDPSIWDYLYLDNGISYGEKIEPLDPSTWEALYLDNPIHHSDIAIDEFNLISPILLGIEDLSYGTQLEDFELSEKETPKFTDFEPIVIQYGYCIEEDNYLKQDYKKPTNLSCKVLPDYDFFVARRDFVFPNIHEEEKSLNPFKHFVGRRDFIFPEQDCTGEPLKVDDIGYGEGIEDFILSATNPISETDIDVIYGDSIDRETLKLDLPFRTIDISYGENISREDLRLDIPFGKVEISYGESLNEKNKPFNLDIPFSLEPVIYGEKLEDFEFYGVLLNDITGYYGSHGIDELELSESFIPINLYYGDYWISNEDLHLYHSKWNVNWNFNLPYGERLNNLYALHEVFTPEFSVTIPHDTYVLSASFEYDYNTFFSFCPDSDICCGNKNDYYEEVIGGNDTVWDTSRNFHVNEYCFGVVTGHQLEAFLTVHKNLVIDDIGYGEFMYKHEQEYIDFVNVDYYYGESLVVNNIKIKEPIRLCPPHTIINGLGANIDLIDLYDYSCNYHEIGYGEALKINTIATSVNLEPLFYYGEWLDFKLHIDDPNMYPYAYYGEWLMTPYEPMGTFYYGEDIIVEMPMNYYDIGYGERIEVDTKERYYVEFMEEECFDNEYIYTGKDGERLDNKTLKFSAEFLPFKHQIKARCF